MSKKVLDREYQRLMDAGISWQWAKVLRDGDTYAIAILDRCCTIQARFTSKRHVDKFLSLYQTGQYPIGDAATLVMLGKA